jgi:hypothetical protein
LPTNKYGIGKYSEYCSEKSQNKKTDSYWVEIKMLLLEEYKSNADKEFIPSK